MTARLLKKSKKGNAAAFEKLITPYEQIIWKICWNLTREAAAAEACALEAIMAVWRNVNRPGAVTGEKELKKRIIEEAQAACEKHVDT